MNIPSSHGLLDLIFIRTNGRTANIFRTGSGVAGESLKRIPRARRIHQAALATTPPPQIHPDSLMSVSNGRGRSRSGRLAIRASPRSLEPGYQLEKRVEALQVTAAKEETSNSPPTFTEDDLRLLYEDLLAIPPNPVPPPADAALLEQQQENQDAETVFAAERRLLQNHPDISLGIVAESQSDFVQSEMRTYWKVLLRAQAIVSHVEELNGAVSRGSDSEGRPVAGPSKLLVPVAVLTLKECEALVRICTQVKDGPGALLSLELMKRSGTPIPENVVTDTLEILAAAGNVKASESLIANFISSPTERQRHLHVKAHLKSTPLESFPYSALDVLHAYEEMALFAPMRTYTACIHFLLFSNSSLARAQGWDLFSHMRYVAHPDPDVWLYTEMIKACATSFSASRSSEPEKALDLWTEMTVDKKLQPTALAYNAVILACARSGETTYVNEAYRIAKEMLEAHRDARGVSAFRPDKWTFCALVEGAKRLGDLARARWILAEIIRGGNGGMDLDGDEEVRVDEEVMGHIFQAYAAYDVPFKRESTVVVQVEHAASNVTDPLSTEMSLSPKEADAGTSRAGSTEEPVTIAPDSIPTFSHLPPQSHEEVISEATFLFQRILHDTGILSAPSDPQERQEDNPRFSPKLINKFSDVKLTTRLIASYISVFFRHAPLGFTEKMFWRVFDQLGVEKNARVYVDALEGCAFAKTGFDKDVAMRFSAKLWTKWNEVEEIGRDGENPLNARLIERAYIARIRLLARTNDVNQALHAHHSFVQRYPPVSIRTPSEKPYLRSTRTSLFGGSRPLVRTTSPLEVPDDRVPPMLTFRDVELLHHRLVALGRDREIGYLKWASKAYEWMLRVRRDESFKTKPVKLAIQAIN